MNDAPLVPWTQSALHALLYALERRRRRGRRRLHGWLERRYAAIPPGPVTLRLPLGLRLAVDPSTDLGIERSLYRLGLYEVQTLEMFRRLLRPGDAVVDAGANIGLMTAWAARCVGPTGRVLAFEPVPAIHAMLQANLRRNGLGQAVALPVALGAAPGRARLHQNLDINRGSGSLVVGDGAGGLDIEVRRLDDVWAELGAGVPRLLKADVEGYEAEVLAGAAGLLNRPDAPMLCVECNIERPEMAAAAARTVEIIRRAAAGYRLYRSEFGKDEVGRLRRLDEDEPLPAYDNLYAFTAAHRRGLDPAWFVP